MKYLKTLFLYPLSGVLLFADATLQSPPGDFGPNAALWPNSTLCSDSLFQPNLLQQGGGIASNNTVSDGSAIRYWNPGQFGPAVLDIATSNRLFINPAPRYPQSLQAALICSDGGTLHLTFSPGGIPTLTLGVFGNAGGKSAFDFVTRGTQLLQYQGNGASYGIAEDFWALGHNYFPFVGLYYYPTDDPTTLYQGIFDFTPGSVQPMGFYYRFKASENRKWIVEGGDGKYIYISDQINHSFFRMDRNGASTTLLSNVSGQLVSTASGEAVVLVKTSAGLQGYRYTDGSDGATPLIVNGHPYFGGTSSSTVLGTISSLSAIPGHGFYAIAQVATGVKALISVIDGVYSELQREDQAPVATMQAVYNSPLAGASNPYLVMTVDGQVVVYQVTASSPNPFVSGLTNSASFVPPTAASANEWLSVFGNNLADKTEQATSVPFPATLGGTSVLLDIAGHQMPAPLSFASPTQINFLMPDLGGTPATALQIQRSSGTTAEKIPLSAGPSDPGVFYYHSLGLVTDPSYRVIDPTTEGIHDQEPYILWANGLGPTSPAVPINQPAPAALTPVVGNPTLTIDGKVADILYIGLTPTAIGLYQIDFVPHLTTSSSPRTVQAVLTLADGAKTTFNLEAQ